MKKKANKRIPCECLDFVEASHRQQVYPLIYCHMKILGHLNNKKGKTGGVAIQQSYTRNIVCLRF